MRKEKQGELLTGLLPFLTHNLGQEVMIRIGISRWKYIKVLEVDAEAKKLRYESNDLPKPVTMELRYIDGFQAASGVRSTPSIF